MNHNTELHFEALTYDDEGEYVCTAKNSVGSTQDIISLDIQGERGGILYTESRLRSS